MSYVGQGGAVVVATDVQPRKQLHKARDRGNGFHRVVSVQARQRQPQQIDQPWERGVRNGGVRGA